jgi:hypothetical protein
MSEAAVESIRTLILLGGGLAGYASVAYLIWKKFKKSFRIYDLGGYYETRKTSNEGFSDIKAVMDVGFFNDSDETISITDIIGSLKYDKELLNHATPLINAPTIPDVYPERPENLDEVISFNIPPHETVKKKIVIVFPNMVVDLVHRIGFAHFGGFLDGKTPFLVADERELKEKWSAHPLNMLLSVHINGRKKSHSYISLYTETEKGVSGTLNIIDIEKIKKDYHEDKDLRKMTK